MNKKLKNIKRLGINHISFNIGLYCNHVCTHCHLKAGPERTEKLDAKLISKVVKFTKIIKPCSFEITGGAPELNPYIYEIIASIRPLVKRISMRTNLTALELNIAAEGRHLNPGGFLKFLYDNNVALVASLPCYEDDEVRVQRGEGVFNTSIAVLKKLNKIGYGVNEGPTLDLVFNPVLPKLPPQQSMLEIKYKEVLNSEFGIKFNRLITMTNVPLGRFAESLKSENTYDGYIKLLNENFNPENLKKLMCLNQVTINWDGRLYDCDFNLAMDLPTNGWSDIDSVLEEARRVKNEKNYSGTDSIIKRLKLDKEIFTGIHCLACTAGSGSSCHGALLE